MEYKICDWCCKFIDCFSCHEHKDCKVLWNGFTQQWLYCKERFHGKWGVYE